MPYLITTKGPDPLEPDYDPHFITSRRAVATLDEARAAIQEALPTKGNARLIARSITEDGGTVGPLPDGTVIEVERIDWRSLALIAEIPNVPARVDVLAVLKSSRIIAAYNAGGGN